MDTENYLGHAVPISYSLDIDHAFDTLGDPTAIPPSSSPATVSQPYDMFYPQPSQSQALAASLSQLPTELVSLILHFLFNPIVPEWATFSGSSTCKELRRDISRTSLVCRSWWIIQRPKLFADLRLKDAGDVNFLLEMLRKRNNGWLPAIVQEIAVASSTDQAWRMLIGKLPSLHTLRRTFHIPNKHPPNVLGVSMRPSLVSSGNLKCLCLWQATFFSFSALSHILADLPKLEELEISIVSWVTPPERLPNRTSVAAFPRLRRIRCGSRDTEMLMWLYAPILARRRAGPPKDVASSNSDTMLFTLLVQQLTALESSSHPTKRDDFEYDAEFIDTDTLQIKTKSGYQVGFVCEVSMWPSDIIPADARRSVIRNVKLLDVLDYQGNPHETSIVWNTAYRCFAEEANKLRTMTIYGSRGIQTNHSHLPRLFMKGRLSIRSKVEWDGLYKL